MIKIFFLAKSCIFVFAALATRHFKQSIERSTSREVRRIPSNEYYFDVFINLHFHSPAWRCSSLRSNLEVFFEKSKFHSFPSVPRKRAPSLRAVSFECCRTRVAHKSPRWTTRHRRPIPSRSPRPIERADSRIPSSRGRHRSCQISPSSVQIPRRRGARRVGRGKSVMRARFFYFFWAISAPGYCRLLACRLNKP